MATCSEIKPVRCGCGGEVVIYVTYFWGKCYVCQCDECGTASRPCDTEAEAITAWNRAMGERTAKVIRLEDGRVVCSACLEPLGIKSNYCRTCGAKLDRSGNE